jgi:peptide/nickel transport system ATP-binding protein
MLEINNLTVGYKEKEVLRGIHLSVESGEILGICGESGTGKTTLGLALMGVLRERDGNVRVSGEILLNNRDLLSMPTEDVREMQWKDIGMIFQNVATALNPVMSVIDQVAEPLSTRCGISRKTALTTAAEKLHLMNLPDHAAQSFPHELSLGERQRALAAMSIVCDPGLLIMDEPFSALDMASRSRLIPVYQRLLRERTGIFISHDIDMLARLCTRIAILYGGMIVEQGAAEKIISEQRHPYTRGLFRSFPSMQRTRDLQGIRGRARFTASGCPFHPRCTQSVDQCRKVRPGLQRISGRQVACHRGGVIRLLEICRISKTYKRRKVLDAVSLHLLEGETLGLVGPSGAGKSTIANIITGLVSADSGGILIEQKPVKKRDREFARTVQMIFQAPADALSHRLTVQEAVREPLDIQKYGDAEFRLQKVKTVLKEAELPTDDDFLNTYPHHLSGGEAQRVVIARSLVLDPRLLLADEPTASLDPSVQAKIMNVLKNIQENRGLGILFITHDIALARKICDHLAVLENGRITASGRTEEILTRLLPATGNPEQPFQWSVEADRKP